MASLMVANPQIGVTCVLSKYAVHNNPVWRDKANFIIHAKLNPGEGKEWEQLWAQQLSGNRFCICCIPVFAYDLALGDEVETGPVDGKNYVVRRVVKPSGHFTFRVWFGDSQVPQIRSEVQDELNRRGALIEWYSHNLLGVSVEQVGAQKVADYLHVRELAGDLVYETGKTM